MIGNGHEACTYLQTYGHWKTAAVVAKVHQLFIEKSYILIFNQLSNN